MEKFLTKRALLALLLLSSLCWLYIQNKKSSEDVIYFYDEHGNRVKNIGSAATYNVISKESDTTYTVRTYKNNGPMIKQEIYKDKQLSIANGRFVWYNKSGRVDSTGITINGKKDGAWEYYNSTTWKDKNGNYKDSLVETNYYQLGKPQTWDDLYGRPDTTGQKIAEFPGKAEAWKKYLEKNLKTNLGRFIPSYPDLIDSRAEEIVSFTITIDGSPSDIYLNRSSGYPFDNEVIRVIKKSGKWEPAEQGGKKVIFRHKQLITFVEL